MYASPPRRRLLLQTVAVCLAGLYGLLAAVGDGLHLVAHLAAPVDCESGHCCDGGCGFDDLAKLRQDTPNQQPLRGASEAEAPASPSDAPRPHGHDCEVCKLLAQLKTASPVVEVTPVTVWVAEVSLPVADVSPAAAPLLAFSARGPPVVV